MGRRSMIIPFVLLIAALVAMVAGSSTATVHSGMPAAPSFDVARGDNQGKVVIAWGVEPEVSHSQIGSFNMD